MEQIRDKVTCAASPLDKLFIYGSLAPNCPNHHIVSHIDGQWQSGTVEGHLVHLGWGASMGFPGIIVSDPTTPKETVKGMMLTSSQLAENWRMLDDFEGKQYQRVIVPVTLGSGEIQSAYIYQINSTQYKGE